MNESTLWKALNFLIQAQLIDVEKRKGMTTIYRLNSVSDWVFPIPTCVKLSGRNVCEIRVQNVCETKRQERV
jgi:hypothetical protein